MSKREKLLSRFRNNPKTVRFDELNTLLLGLGFEKRQSGSHATYTREQHIITFPFRKPYVLPVYVKNILAILDALESSSNDKQTEETE